MGGPRKCKKVQKSAKKCKQGVDNEVITRFLATIFQWG